MCDHRDVVVAHYGFHIKGEIGDRLACVVRCAHCDNILFKSDNKGIEAAYNYIDINKDSFKTLMDLTCDDLNRKYNIASGLE